MYAGEAGYIRYFPIALCAARLHIVSVGLENAGKLQLTAPALSLLCLSREYQLLSNSRGIVGTVDTVGIVVSVGIVAA